MNPRSRFCSPRARWRTSRSATTVRVPYPKDLGGVRARSRALQYGAGLRVRWLWLSCTARVCRTNFAFCISHCSCYCPLPSVQVRGRCAEVNLGAASSIFCDTVRPAALVSPGGGHVGGVWRHRRNDRAHRRSSLPRRSRRALLHGRPAVLRTGGELFKRTDSHPTILGY